MLKPKLLLLFVSAFFLSAYLLTQFFQDTAIPANSPPSQPSPSPETNRPASASYTMADVSAHADAQSCWLVIESNVYDVTSFISAHPGRETILQGCGLDATELFNTRPMGSNTPHSGSARARLESYLIGTLAE